MIQAELIEKILHTDYLETAEINEFEHIRESLRDLMKYILNTGHAIYETNFDDEILWNEVGTKEEYEAKCGQKPLGEFVREIVGVDIVAAKAAFAEFLDETNLDSR